jgi:acetylornithine deacetylase/succinyl-diaminopimelate desuccinylase-like protein
MTSADLDQLRRAVDGGFDRAVGDLKDLVRIPSVSWAAYDRAHVRASAEAVRELVAGTGLFDDVAIEQVDDEQGRQGQPAVLARREARGGAPTVLLYAHHDVQPWGDEALWRTPPFEPTEVGERLYGRGASDDKAGVMTHVAALRAFAETHPDPDLGLVLFVEGEEEFGSRSFGRFLQTHADTLAADVIVVADSDNWSTDVPSLTVALRGNVTFRLAVRTLEHASHSGMYGGAVPDAMLAAIRTLDTLWAADGSVAVEGLTSHDAPTPERDEAQLREEAALLEGVRLLGAGSLLSRSWFQPSITVTGIDAPSVADASNTLLPEVAVRVSARIAPGQSAQSAFDALRTHLESHAAFGAHLDISDVDLGEPVLVDVDGWAAGEAQGAMAEAWGAEPVLQGIGGSIPFIAQLVAQFPNAQILVTGVEDPETMAHSPNESQHLGVLRKAILAEAALLARANARPVR